VGNLHGRILGHWDRRSRLVSGSPHAGSRNNKGKQAETIQEKGGKGLGDSGLKGGLQHLGEKNTLMRRE